jgi:hypothetical protein
VDEFRLDSDVVHCKHDVPPAVVERKEPTLDAFSLYAEKARAAGCEVPTVLEHMEPNEVAIQHSVEELLPLREHAKHLTARKRGVKH